MTEIEKENTEIQNCEKIYEILEIDHPVDSCDFEALKKDYLWENRLRVLKEKMDYT